MELISSALAFIFTIAVLVTFHEFGHFWVARRCGVKVLTFSVGFGKPVWQKRGKDGVNYQVAAIPLGGYVKMFGQGEQAGDEQIDAPADQAFDNKTVAQRFAIVAAGPVFNLVLAFAFYWLLFLIGSAGLKPVIGAPAPNSVAAESQLQAGDQITAVNGKAVKSWQQLHERLLAGIITGKPANIELLTANGAVATDTLAVDKLNAGTEPSVLFRQLGLSPPDTAAVFIRQVMPNSAAEAAGLQPEDQVISFAGKSVTGPNHFTQLIEQYGGQSTSMLVNRGGEQRQLAVTPALINSSGQQCGKLGVGIRAEFAGQDDLRTNVRAGPVAAIPAAIGETVDKAWLTVSMMWRMVTGNISLRHISGPLTIADYAGETARIGLTAFLGFMALVSISLAVLNLLPIPMLDGGHLLFYVIEAVRGRALSARSQQLAMAVGMAAVLALMVLAISNDVRRLVPNQNAAALQQCAWGGLSEN